ncbi:MAG: hypothetical protein WCH92_05350 [Betaproteobacteria bacterium]
MSTENTIQPTANPGSAKVAEKSATATTQISLATAKKTARKATKRAPRKTAIKAPVKTKAIVNKKPVNKTPAAPTKKASTQPKVKAKAAPTVPPVVEAKLKKPKLVRDSFTFPKDEYQAIAGLKQKALGLKHSAKKSEILRAGLKLLSSLNDKAFLAALTNVPALKTGRPAKS